MEPCVYGVSPCAFPTPHVHRFKLSTALKPEESVVSSKEQLVQLCKGPF